MGQPVSSSFWSQNIESDDFHIVKTRYEPIEKSRVAFFRTIVYLRNDADLGSHWRSMNFPLDPALG